MNQFANRVALVTGAASGIGAACARLLALQGATICCADLNADGARAVATSLRTEAPHSGRLLDVADEAQWEIVMEAIRTDHGALDIMVHAAGISAGSPLAETAFEEWRRVLSINLDGAFLAVKHGIRSMRDRGGAIVLLGSASGTRPTAGAAAYSTSKAGLAMLARTAAKECREAGLRIRVNLVSPAGVKTPMWSTMPFFQDLVRQHGSEDAAYAALAGPGGRFAEPEDVARSVAFLASDASGHITGVELLVDGGYVL